MARDDRPFGGKDPPAVAYTYAPGRGAVHLHTLLKDYRGIVQCDGYAPYNKLPDDAITLAFCWARIAALHKIEAAINRLTALGAGSPTTTYYDPFLSTRRVASPTDAVTRVETIAWLSRSVLQSFLDF